MSTIQITFVCSKDHALVDMEDVKAFSSSLATERKVAASSQNQAFNALLFLFRHVFEKPFENVEGVVRAKRKSYIPVVLSRDEVDRVVDHLSRPAPKELVWQWFFPASALTRISQPAEQRRYQLHETVVQKAIKTAVAKAQIPKRVSAHSFRHSFASHFLQANYAICTIQKLLGHSESERP